MVDVMIYVSFVFEAKCFELLSQADDGLGVACRVVPCKLVSQVLSKLLVVVNYVGKCYRRLGTQR